MRTQVGIVGAGPTGLLLAQLLHLRGIRSVVIEARSRDHVESRIRGAVLEHATVEALREAEVGERLTRTGMPHDGVRLRFGGRTRRIDVRALTGRQVTLYAQHELVCDLVAARLATGQPTLFEVEEVMLHDLRSARPQIRFRHGDRAQVLDCDIIAGCDGFHGVCRPAIPDGTLHLHERLWPFGWLAILAEAPPSCEEMVYTSHPHGFALLSLRSPSLARLSLQCAPDEGLDAWPDDRIWEELRARTADENGFVLQEGRIVQKEVTVMRSFAVEPMQYGRLFLAGDAAHVLPPTGAKGLNAAVADVIVLARALEGFFRRNDREGLAHYSETALRRGWKVQRFSWWMTSMLHRFPRHSAFERQMQLAELDYVTSTRAGATSLAENYVGLPPFLDA